MLFRSITAWGTLAEGVATLDKGARVIVVGSLNQERFESNGQKLSAIVINADAVGEDFRFKVGSSAPAIEGSDPF